MKDKSLTGLGPNPDSTIQLQPSLLVFETIRHTLEEQPQPRDSPLPETESDTNSQGQSEGESSTTSGEYHVARRPTTPLRDEHRQERISVNNLPQASVSPAYSSTSEEPDTDGTTGPLPGLTTSPLENAPVLSSNPTTRQRAGYIDDILWFNIRNRGQENGRPTPSVN